jgi:hypothetical protein
VIAQAWVDRHRRIALVEHIVLEKDAVPAGCLCALSELDEEARIAAFAAGWQCKAVPHARILPRDVRGSRRRRRSLAQADVLLETLVDVVSASPWTYAVILGIAALDALLPLVPSETAVISAGVLAGAGDLQLGLVIAAGAAGAYVGDSSAYWVGRRLDCRLAGRLFRGAKGARRRAWASERSTVTAVP